MSEPSVVVTGIGIFGKAGCRDDTFRIFNDRKSLLEMTVLPDAEGFIPFAAAPASRPPVEAYLTDRKMVKYMSPASALAVTAAGEALEQAGLLDDAGVKGSMGLFAANSLTAFDLSSIQPAVTACRRLDGTFDMSKLGSDGFSRCHPLMPFKILGNMPLGLVSIAFGIKGDNFILYPSASQGAACIEAALGKIRAGRLTCALVGGTCQGVGLLPVSTLHRTGHLATEIMCSSGYAPADGAAFLVLESETAASDRGVEILATLQGAFTGGGARRVIKDRKHKRYESCHRRLSTGTGGVNSVFSTGHLSDSERRQEAQALEAAGIASEEHLCHPELLFGHLAAASMPFAVALAVSEISSGRTGGAATFCYEPEGRWGGAVLVSPDAEGERP